jgi:hypothetical protein
MQTVLTIPTGPAGGRRIEIGPGASSRLIVGRSEGCDVVLSHDSFLSGKHFELEYTPEGCRVRNLGTNGIVVSGAPTAEAILRDGDLLYAGQTAFQVEVEESGPPLGVLQRQALPVFALLDAARNPRVPELLKASGESHQMLYEGEKGQELALVAPYLVALPPKSELLRHLVERHWGTSVAVYLTSQLPLDLLRAHFRQFLMVQPEGKPPALFRFYDPRVLRVYLPTCTPAEAAVFFGPVRKFFVESESARSYHRFRFTPEGLENRQIQA